MSLISDVKHELAGLDLTDKSLRKFGVTMGLVSSLAAAWFLITGVYAIGFIFIFITALFFVTGYVFPSSLSRFNKVWMGLAFFLGWIVSRVILAFLFVFILTPIGFIAKLAGKRFMDIKFPGNKNTYWIPKEKPSDFTKMY